jgi:hypothetical protein
MKNLDPLFIARIIALSVGGAALLYATCCHGYHFGPGLSSPVDLHVDIKEAYEDKIKKEDPDLYERYTRDYDHHENNLRDEGYCGDHGRDYN